MGGMEMDAVFDTSGAYRYSLTRTWDAARPRVAMILLNPSTADAHRDDPTLRRCIGFAREWGFGALEVVNLFAFRATLPRHLRQADDPVGAENDAFLRRALAAAQRAVAAWGVHGAFARRDREVLRLAGEGGHALACAGLTRDGHPRHLLYLPRGTPLRAFAAGTEPHA